MKEGVFDSNSAVVEIMRGNRSNESNAQKRGRGSDAVYIRVVVKQYTEERR